MQHMGMPGHMDMHRTHGHSISGLFLNFVRSPYLVNFSSTLLRFSRLNNGISARRSSLLGEGGIVRISGRGVVICRVGY